jgi:hypothetical protein
MPTDRHKGITHKLQPAVSVHFLQHVAGSVTPSKVAILYLAPVKQPPSTVAHVTGFASVAAKPPDTSNINAMAPMIAAAAARGTQPGSGTLQPGREI